MAMVIIHTHITAQQKEAIKSETARTGISRAEIIRRSIDAYLKNGPPGRESERIYRGEGQV